MPTLPAHASPRHRLLFVIGTLLALFGVVFVALGVAFPDLLAKLYATLATGGTVADAGPTARFATGLYGALTLGWGAMIALLARGVPLPRASLMAALLWFVVDGTVSVLSGFGWNALTNLGFLAPFLALLPTLAPARQTGAVAG